MVTVGVLYFFFLLSFLCLPVVFLICGWPGYQTDERIEKHLENHSSSMLRLMSRIQRARWQCEWRLIKAIHISKKLMSPTMQ